MPVSEQRRVQDEAKQCGAPKSSRPTSSEFDTLPQLTDQLAIIRSKLTYSSTTPLNPHNVLTLQQAYGNRAVRRLITRQTRPHSDVSLIQAKLTVGPADDPYEKEADRVAAQVVSQINAPQNQTTDSSNSVQRRLNSEEDSESAQTSLARSIQLQEGAEEENELKRKPLSESFQPQAAAVDGSDVSSEVESAIQSARGGGQPLAENVRVPMERAFGAGLNRVRVHSDAKADGLNRSLHARAFTSGHDVFFRAGQYDPNSREGQQLIAHELTHVLQQDKSAPDLLQSTSTQTTSAHKEQSAAPPVTGGTLQLKYDSEMPCMSNKTSLTKVNLPEGLIQRVYSRELNLKAQAATGIRAELLKGTENLPENQVLGRILLNFANIGFCYSMVHVSPNELLGGRLEGDCRTLAEAFVQLANEIGFADVMLGYKDKIEIMVPGKQCIDKNRRPNVDRGRHWAFQNHYWGIDSKGNLYDVLFTASQVDAGETKWAHKEGPTQKDASTGLEYEVYGGKRFYSGFVGSQSYDMVFLEEGELAQIRESYKKLQEAKVPSRGKEEETESEEPKKEGSVFDWIAEVVEDFVPKDKVDQTARALEKLIDKSQVRNATVSPLLKPHIAMFCDGSNLMNFSFNEEKWREWIKSQKS